MNANNKNYTIRPLSEEEKEFAGDWNNYNYLFFYMRKWGLDQEIWYDIFIEPYLNAVKKYHEYESARQYAFSTVLKNMLYTAFTKELKMERALKRIPKDKMCSLDYTLLGDNPFCEYQVEEWWIDRKQQVETIVLDKELFMEILMKLDKVQREIFEMLLDGYKKSEIKRTLNISSALLEHEMEYIKNVTYMCMA